MEKETILKVRELREHGFSYSKIAKVLNISDTAARYNSNDGYKEQAKARSVNYRAKEPMQVKMMDFYVEAPLDRNFDLRDVKKKFDGKWFCYLTGAPIDPLDTASYSFDHIIPKAKGGKSNLENMGVLRKDVNEAKSSKTPEEFLALCKRILEYNGYAVSRL